MTNACQPSPCYYFPEGTTPARRFVQNPGVKGVVKEQTQPLAQSAVALHLPPQVTPFASLRNWRAETVPAHRTAATMVANSVFLPIFLNIGLYPFLD
jgi:hypothetical protein